MSIVVALAVCMAFLMTPTVNGSPELLRGIGFFLLGAGVAPLGLFLAYNRTESLKLQTETEKEKAVTEAFAKSVELLGNQREATRQGGVYALGRLADDNPGLHPMIMDIVASYIRQESSRWFIQEEREREKREGKPVGKDELVNELHRRGMPMDIEAAIAVIRKRKVKNDKEPTGVEPLLDLSNACIINANFSNASLTKVNFSDSVMAHCLFNKTNLSKSNFVGANLSGSSVIESDLEGAHITQEQVNSLQEIDEETALPEGLSLPN